MMRWASAGLKPPSLADPSSFNIFCSTVACLLLRITGRTRRCTGLWLKMFSLPPAPRLPSTRPLGVLIFSWSDRSTVGDRMSIELSCYLLLCLSPAMLSLDSLGCIFVFFLLYIMRSMVAFLLTNRYTCREHSEARKNIGTSDTTHITQFHTVLQCSAQCWRVTRVKSQYRRYPLVQSWNSSWIKQVKMSSTNSRQLLAPMQLLSQRQWWSNTCTQRLQLRQWKELLPTQV